ncbi:MAG TPA: hypothetical protein EYQ84_09870 [Nitrospinaceae bacterium]|nr:hypothetical protein [Nitrospinaceae bacterium]
MHIYFDLDNTLIDELEQNVRPGMFELLESFKVKPYVTYTDTDPDELEELHRMVLPDVRFSIKKQSWVTKKLNLLFKKKPVPSWIK